VPYEIKIEFSGRRIEPARGVVAALPVRRRPPLDPVGQLSRQCGGKITVGGEDQLHMIIEAGRVERR
jgi:hypothetical protein